MKLKRQFNVLPISVCSFMLLLIPLAMLLYSCDSEKLSKLESENSKMRQREIERDSIMKNLVSVFAKVDSNMKIISSHEQNINRQIISEHNKKINSDSVLYYIGQIDTLTRSNEQLVDRLESQFGAQNHNIIGLRQLISSLNDKNQFKNNELGELKSRLATINDDFRELFDEFVHTEVEKMELDEYNAALREKNERLLEQLNTGFLSMGTKSELKEKGLTDSRGIIFDIDMNENLDKNLFTKVDIRDLTFVELNVRKAKIISKHPESSYEFIGSKKSIEKLLIKEPKEFWSVSKYLLIEIEE